MLRVKNWSTYQSYKDRSPPWIRLHVKLLENFQYHRMSLEARALLPMLWLLAAKDEDPVSGLLRFGYEEIAFRLRWDALNVKKACDELVRFDFIENVTTEEKDLFSASYETVTDSLLQRTDTDTEVLLPDGNNTAQKSAKALGCPSGVDKAVWQDFQHLRKQKRSPLTQTALDGIQAEADKAGISLNDALKECCARGWQGFKAEWFNKNAKGNGYVNNTGQRPSKSERARAAALRGAGLDAGDE